MLKVTGIRGNIDRQLGYAQECSRVAWPACVMELCRLSFSESIGPIAVDSKWCKVLLVVESEERVELAGGGCALCWSYNGLGRNRVSTQPIGRTDTRDGERSYQITEG